MSVYEANGPGTPYLPYPALQFLLSTDPFLGTTVPGVPDGPFNRELHKLLQNTSALANLFVGYLSRTYGTVNSAAPVANTVPVPLAGAPSTPANLAMHTVYYNNYEVVYSYNGTSGAWVEKARMLRVYTAFDRFYKKVTIALSDDLDNVAITLPTTDSMDRDFEFTLDHLKCFYVLNLDDAAPIVSVLPGLTVEDDTTIRVVLSSAPADGSDYQLVLVFEHISLL